MKCFEKNKKKGKDKERSPKMLRINHFGSYKTVVLNQVRLKAQLRYKPAYIHVGSYHD